MRWRGSCSTGFRGRRAQAKALDEITATRGPVICVEIQVPDEELVRRVRARRVCEDCGANADAFEHQGRCAAGPVPEHRAVPIDRPEVGGALGRFGVGGARAVEGLLARYAADDRVLQLAADVPVDRRVADAGAGARSAGVGGGVGVGHAGGAVADAGEEADGERRAREATEVQAYEHRLPVGGGDREAGAGQRAGGARAQGARRGGPSRRDDEAARRAGRAAVAGSGRGAGVQGVSRIPGDDLRVGERAGRARDSERSADGRRATSSRSTWARSSTGSSAIRR